MELWSPKHHPVSHLIQCDPSSVDNGGWTPLHDACIGDYAYIVQPTGKVDPMLESKFGNTPVYCANIGRFTHDRLLQ